ncbi:homeobox domain-containing protein [Favolaschia claudopus]|uniref:Homeobox domain-containing protein n=1 Tax=Favolaschia claudopus TaxID=2862362 RepID=A0AAW0AA66_9AGAR
MSNRDDRYYNTHRARTPAPDQSGVFFQTGQGGRTLLPPISSAFPISHFPGPPPHYSQPRSSPNRYDYNQSYNNQWQPNNAPMAAPQFGYYDDPRYSQPTYPAVYNQRPATVAPGHHHSDPRKLPPLNTTPTPRQDERWASPYQNQPYNGAPTANSHIRSPTASYPPSYTASSYPPSNAYGYDPRCVPSLSPQLMANDPRAYGRGGSPPHGHHGSPPTPPPISPVSPDEPTVKKKRKRADAGQLRILNETYARTAFPSTEERLALAKALDMSPRSVQIWFQNKRQSMRQTNRQSTTAHQSFSLSPDDNADDIDYESSVPGPATSRSLASQIPPTSSNRRGRSHEDTVLDSRKWGRGY